ncbi:bifunctional (p)ppGpp synthetase/guanosine-3',5'-bis(diphosphate) 3'-pyrophosphohydrolase [Nitrosomonas sp. Nm33]|uniref:RelA/SpoT family protein n=1 Tax=Nitrosomonas sp. Nm33 TaxID=133724 RepID=UPI00089C883F|nr:bifunctional (p)ppGpp synthetase/guanosine-3',5'-bis(diphosphate) 3'-pyrophosphohydrolase [Nitrosomonas sp. Nm33]SDY84259.1 GTP pyrophosphokinase [Nitrosomonas sp. Nm33]
MVSTRSKFLQSTADYTDTEAWLNELAAQFASAEITLLRQACAMATPLYSKQHTLTGMPLLLHAIGAASILIGMRMDVETVTATLLHAVPEYLDDWYAQVENQFGVSIAELVKGISRMEQIRQFSEIEQLDASGGRGDQAQQIESLRQMLLAMVQDIRVVLIKLAERMQTMRYLSGASSELQQRIACETRGIFAPLANRLGVWQIKWELEDLALRYLEPQLYKEIARLLDERRVDREQYIADVIAQLKQELLQANIKGEVSGRPKHIHSIINKMRRKNLEFNELYDIRAMRILVDDIKDCYAALGLVHHLWQPIPGEFDDYIARPKSNGYRSLHTAVIGPRGLALEVQIRTHDMHHNSELGVAAHWRYKEDGKSDSKFDEKIAWLRQILAWKDEVSDGGDLLEQFKSELFQDKVFVLTPQGKVIDLPKGSTPIDFAYALHTDLGHRTRGAKVDGRIVPLNTHLLNGQRVEILTSKLGAPSRDWLNPALGYLQSPRSRAKVRYWFKYQNFEENVAVGRVKLDRELHRAGVGSMNQEKLAHKLHYNHLEDLLAAIGRGDVSEHQIALAIQETTPPKPAEAPPVFTTKHMPPLKAPSGIVVEGVGNLLINLAKCCKPVPPDVIVGYITRDRGMSIHRQTCAFVTRLPEERHARLLHAHWGAGANLVTSVDIEVEAHDRQGLLRDISDLFVREKVNATKVNATKGNTQSRSNLAKMQFSLEITNLDQLQRLLALIQQVPDVITARRRE